MTNGRPAILEITEEKIFKTLGRGVPVCELLREVGSNAARSVSVIDLAIKQMPPDRKEEIKGLEVIYDRQKINLSEIKNLNSIMKC